MILRVGNIHQRNGRNWLAIDSYRRVLELPPADEPASVDARRKALVNLEGLLESAGRQVNDAIASLPRPVRPPEPEPVPAAAGRGKGGPVGRAQRGGVPPAVEYLGSR